jgi:hypothetical protein
LFIAPKTGAGFRKAQHLGSALQASAGGTVIYGRMPVDHNKTAGIAGGQNNQLTSQ